jgi:hypothetical protein
MPKLKTDKAKRKYNELNDLRRNMKYMTLEEQEGYCRGEELRKILGNRFLEFGFHMTKEGAKL